MKKNLLFLATLALSASAALAAEPANGLIESVDFNVAGQTEATDEDGTPIEDAYIVPSVNANVTITFKDYQKDKALKEGWTPYLMVTTGSGFAIDSQVFPLEESSADTYTYDMTKASWGNPYMGNYYTTLVVCFLNAEEDYYMTGEGYDAEPVMYQVSYQTPNVFPAELLGVYPDNNWEYDTFADAYAMGEMRFFFNNPIGFSDNEYAAAVTYILKNGDSDIVEYAFDPDYDNSSDNEDPQDIMLGWDYMDGNYMVSVNIFNSAYSAQEIASIIVELYDVTGMAEVETIDMTIDNNDPAVLRNSLHKSRTAGISETLTHFDALGTIYNVQGAVVRENAKDLKGLNPGLYIVNGKKFIVR